MAGDWIKMEVCLPDKPEVWQMAGMLGIDPDSVIGKLLRVWGWFDSHTTDGNAHGVTFSLVDRVAGVAGFAEAMMLCGWIEQSGSVLSIPNFSRHNGKTAKNRALTNDRVAKSREKKQESNDESNAECVTKTVTREEKRREEVNNTPATPDGFADFWSAYPKRKNKGDAEKAWKKIRPSIELQQRILAAIVVAKRQPDWIKEDGQYIPYPASWLNAKGWEDGQEAPASLPESVTASVDGDIVTLPNGQKIPRAAYELNRRMMG